MVIELAEAEARYVHAAGFRELLFFIENGREIVGLVKNQPEVPQMTGAWVIVPSPTVLEMDYCTMGSVTVGTPASSMSSTTFAMIATVTLSLTSTNS